MAQYAYFDSTISPGPAPVLGWYDSSLLNYPNLPSMSNLLEVSALQWAARLTGFWAVQGGALVSYTPPVSLSAQAQQVYSAAIAAGIVITCTGNSALSATYALDPITLSQIGTVAADFASNLGLPGGISTFTYPDKNSIPRTFTGAQLVALYQAQRNLVFVLSTQQAIMANGGTPSWPAQSATIP